MTRRPPGAGSVTRTPHGTWRVRVRDANGRRRCVGTYADEAEARATLAAAINRLAEQDLSAVGVVTLKAWGDSWLASREARGVDKERSVWRRHRGAQRARPPAHVHLAVCRRGDERRGRAAVDARTDLADGAAPLPRAVVAEAVRRDAPPRGHLRARRAVEYRCQYRCRAGGMTREALRCNAFVGSGRGIRSLSLCLFPCELAHRFRRMGAGPRRIAVDIVVAVSDTAPGHTLSRVTQPVPG